jgi:hypothetical protein
MRNENSMVYHSRNPCSKPSSHLGLPQGVLRSRCRSDAPSHTIRMDARAASARSRGNAEAKELYNPLFIGTLEKHPRFSLHCYTNPFILLHRCVRKRRVCNSPPSTGEESPSRQRRAYEGKNQCQSGRQHMRPELS